MTRNSPPRTRSRRVLPESSSSPTKSADPRRPPLRAGVTHDPPEIPSKESIRAIATSSLLSVAQNGKAPPAARAAASRTLLESLGDIGRLQDVVRGREKPLNEMNARELDEEIARLQPKKR